MADLCIRDGWLLRRSFRSCLDFYRFAAKISQLVNAGEEGDTQPGIEKFGVCLPCPVQATVALGMALGRESSWFTYRNQSTS